MIEFFELEVILYFTTLVLMLGFILIFLNILVSGVAFENDKLHSYECGFDPYSFSYVPFNLHFLLVGLLFLIFDLELVLVIPFIFSKSVTSYYVINIFILQLLIVYKYEYENKSFSWFK